MALKAYAGLARFKTTAPDTTFQVGMQSPTMPLSITLVASSPFKTAFQCSVAANGALEYDTVVSISNRSEVEISVEVKINNAENGEVVVNTIVKIGPWKTLTYSLAGALK